MCSQVFSHPLAYRLTLPRTAFGSLDVHQGLRQLQARPSGCQRCLDYPRGFALQALREQRLLEEICRSDQGSFAFPPRTTSHLPKRIHSLWASAQGPRMQEKLAHYQRRESSPRCLVLQASSEMDLLFDGLLGKC
jgi:hypothetical protein